MAKILLGPVIGLVTSDTARILLEVDTSSTVTMVICDPGDTKHRVFQQMPAGGARVFQFTNLEPETAYKISIEGADRCETTPEGSFRTLSTDPQKMRVIALSCDSTECETGTDMWKVLHDRLQTQPCDVILHLGDNVYMDVEQASMEQPGMMGCLQCSQQQDSGDHAQPYQWAVSRISGLDPAEWPQHSGVILEKFRQRYRDVWGRRYKADILATCSNVMILDDHEIRDDLGDKPEDRDEASPEFYVNSLALQVYHEYQRQLWDPDILSTNHQASLKNEFFTLRLGPLSVAMIDARTSRAMYMRRRQAGDRSFYGLEQTRSFMEMLDPGQDNDTRMWLIGCAIPLLFFTREFNKALLKLTEGNDDVQAFIDRELGDLKSIYDVIRDWKKAKAPDGDVMLLAGDVHVGGFTDIYYKPRGADHKDLVCRQITTSPIRNKQWKAHEYILGMTSLLTCTERQCDYKYKHYDWQNRCNFLVIDLDFSAARQVQYDVSLVLEALPGQSVTTVDKSSASGAAWCPPDRGTRCFNRFFDMFCSCRTDNN